jgi:hypothetical protein
MSPASLKYTVLVVTLVSCSVTETGKENGGKNLILYLGGSKA